MKSVEKSKHGHLYPHAQFFVFLTHFPVQHKLFLPLLGHVVVKIPPEGMQALVGAIVVGALVVGLVVGVLVVGLSVGLAVVGTPVGLPVVVGK